MKNIVKTLKSISMRIYIIAIAIFLGFVTAFLGGWEYLEPLIGLVTVGVSAATYLQTQKAKAAHYSDNGDGEWVVALQVGRPVSEAVIKHFGQCDAIIDVVAVTGSNIIVTEHHYVELAKSVYKAAMIGQGKNVRLVMSGPVGLAVIIGQLIGLHHINCTVYQFDMPSGGYIALPKASRDML